MLLNESLWETWASLPWNKQEKSCRFLCGLERKFLHSQGMEPILSVTLTWGCKTLSSARFTPISHRAAWPCQDSSFLFLPSNTFSCQCSLSTTALVTRVQSPAPCSGQRVPGNLRALWAVPHLQQIGSVLFSPCSLPGQFFHSGYAAPQVFSSAVTATGETRKHFREAVVMSAFRFKYSCKHLLLSA